MSSHGAPRCVQSGGAAEEHANELDERPAGIANSSSKDTQISSTANAYTALGFGDWSAYARNKRAKLLDQQADMSSAADAAGSDALRGCAVYINGYTNPPYAELRRLIVMHGGRVVEYLDRKGEVTHVVATTLPPRKRNDYKNLCVVRPEWVLESCRIGKAADTHKWRLDGPHGLDRMWGAAGAADKEAAEAGEKGATGAAKVVDNGAAKAATEAATGAAGTADDPSQQTQDTLSSFDDADFANESFVAALIALDATPKPAQSRTAALLQDDEWRAAHTAAGKDFLEGYYANSRLHLLSTAKSQLCDLVSAAASESGRSLCSPDLPSNVPRVLMHIDFDCFFASVALRTRPHLRCKPVAVCHAAGKRSTADVASCNYEARACGVKNGMSLGRAMELCPQLVTLPYEFDAYMKTSLQLYALLLDHCDALEVGSMDEAFVDVSLVCARDAPPIEHARALQKRVLDDTSCPVSIGIGSNVLLARLATRRAKPAGICMMSEEDACAMLKDMQVDQLPGIGYAVRERLEEAVHTSNIGEVLARVTLGELIHILGPRRGRMLWDKMHARDASELQGVRPRQCISTHVSWGVRFQTHSEVHEFLKGLCAQVTRRAESAHLVGRHAAVQIMQRAPGAPIETPKFLGHGACITHHRSATLPRPTCAAQTILDTVWPLVEKLDIPPSDVRGVGVSLEKLESVEEKREARLEHFGWVMQGAKPAQAEQPRHAAESAQDTKRDEAPVDVEPNPFTDSPDTQSQFVIPPPSQIDLDVVAALPSKMAARVRARIEAAQPKASQIDPDVLAEIPEWVRAQVLAEYAPPIIPETPRRRQASGFGQSPRTPRSTRSPRMRSPRTRSPRSKTPTTPRGALLAYLDTRQASPSPPPSPTTEAVSATPHASLEEALAAQGIDMSVYRALPAPLRQEIAAAGRSYTARFRPAAQVGEATAAARRRAAAEAAGNDTDSSECIGPLHPQNAPLCARRENIPPTRLHPAQSLTRLRELITAWVSAFDEPRHGDVVRLEEVLVDCVHRGALYRAAAALRWWQDLAPDKPSWHNAITRVRRAVERAVGSSVDI
ncbi:deoxycytidyl transferase [Malassezia cuniculi]|uniref:DNA repair protein REV1 n=1 Tax=Malassezia cuniculi TaxID=948313 RepID=A0AAF0JAH9_9BASI|nr:deoxycytidyl transferase [Malassezia cuniculi]